MQCQPRDADVGTDSSIGTEERDTALYHGRHAGPRLIGLDSGKDAELDETTIRAAIFHQHRHVHILALRLALISWHGHTGSLPW